MRLSIGDGGGLRGGGAPSPDYRPGMFRRLAVGNLVLERVVYEPGEVVPREFQKVRVSAFPTHGQWPHARGRERHVVAARRNRVLVGFCLLFTDLEEGHADLNDLAVRSDQQRAGVGHAVCAHAVEWMRELGIREITGWAIHPGSQRIFNGLGFEPHPRLPGSVLHVG